MFVLKSLDRINNMIDKGLIKRMFIFDGWKACFARKIIELYGSKVEINIIRNSLKSIEGLTFESTDCILFYEESIKDCGSAKQYVINAAKHSKAFIKVLTEDIFSVKNING